MVAKILPRYRENIKEKYMRQSYSQYLKRCILVWRYHMLGSEGYTNNRTDWLGAYFLCHKYWIQAEAEVVPSSSLVEVDVEVEVGVVVGVEVEVGV